MSEQTETKTVGASVTYEGAVDLTPWKHERVAAAMEWLCERLHHAGACALLNGRFYVGHRSIRIFTDRLWYWTWGR